MWPIPSANMSQANVKAIDLFLESGQATQFCTPHPMAMTTLPVATQAVTTQAVTARVSTIYLQAASKNKLRWPALPKNQASTAREMMVFMISLVPP
jgi:hypothetical protein